MIVVLAVIAITYVFDRYYPHTTEKASTVKQEQQATLPAKSEKKTAAALPGKPETNKQQTDTSGAGKQKAETKPETNKSKSSKSSVSSVTFPKDAEIPRLLVKRKEQKIRYTGHTVSYNVDYKVSNWVAWELTGEEAKSTANERSNKFVPDPDLKGQTAMNEDYSRTGYDKGHMLPAGDVKWSAKAMRESFYYSNICPQVPGLNRGVWKELEEQCRLWAKENATLLIVTGPVIENDLRPLGKNRVAIPHRFYKVIATIRDNKYQGIGFLMDNRDYGLTSLKEVAVPIDSVERVTGIDFFPTLPDQQEKEMEETINWACWSF